MIHFGLTSIHVNHVFPHLRNKGLIGEKINAYGFLMSIELAEDSQIRYE